MSHHGQTCMVNILPITTRPGHVLSPGVLSDFTKFNSTQSLNNASLHRSHLFTRLHLGSSCWLGIRLRFSERLVRTILNAESEKLYCEYLGANYGSHRGTNCDYPIFVSRVLGRCTHGFWLLGWHRLRVCRFSAHCPCVDPPVS